MSKKRKVKLFVILFICLFIVLSLSMLNYIIFSDYHEKPVVLGTIGITFLYSLILDGGSFGVMGYVIKSIKKKIWIKNHK